MEPVDDIEFAESFGQAIIRLTRWQRSESAKLPTPLPVALMSILSSLDRLGPATPTELAARENVRKPSITRLLDTLELRGFVVRDDHPSDGRQSVVSITSSGLEALSIRRATIAEHYLDLVSGLAPRDIKAIKAATPALSRLTQNLP